MHVQVVVKVIVLEGVIPNAMGAVTEGVEEDVLLVAQKIVKVHAVPVVVPVAVTQVVKIVVSLQVT